MAMLDLTADFDTIDHTTLFRRLNKTFGVSGSSLAGLNPTCNIVAVVSALMELYQMKLNLNVGHPKVPSWDPFGLTLTSNQLDTLFGNAIYFFIYMPMIPKYTVPMTLRNTEGENIFVVQRLQNCIHAS